MNRGVALRILTMLAVVVVTIVGVAIFFKVEKISVQGNGLYAIEEIVTASELNKGDNMITISKSLTAGNIMAVLPYVEEVRIDRMLPNQVVITVKESEAAYSIISMEGDRWLMNSNGKILEIQPESAAEYPKITGVVITNPVVGEMVQCEQTENLEALKAILEPLESTDYISKIHHINVEQPFDIIMEYEDQFEIRLGSVENMDLKIQSLTGVLGQLDSTESGIIDLTFDEEKVPRFRPWQKSKILPIIF